MIRVAATLFALLVEFAVEPHQLTVGAVAVAIILATKECPKVSSPTLHSRNHTALSDRKRELARAG
jgi:hypothetical protein